MPSTHQSHRGELLLQQRRNTPRELGDAIPDYIQSDMPQQHADFFSGLSYLPIATLDGQGRPWASLLITLSGDDPTLGVTVSGRNRMEIAAETNAFDPLARALNQTASIDGKPLFAGVGVDFTNRRRNKIAGHIDRASVDETGKVSLTVSSDQHLGNCPKYITLRTLEHEHRASELAFDEFETITSALPDAAKTVVDRASTVFLATKHIAEGESVDSQTDMGLNHRGGAPGFTRIYEETDGDRVTTYLIVPDHAGNRFYQSLGNIETDPQVGLVFPDFATSDVLYITGVAENLHDAEAEAIMPRVGLLTRIKVTGAVFVRNGLNLRMVSEEQFSPYNPPVKYLQKELKQMGHATVAHEDGGATKATLVSTQALSERIRTFTFELSEPIDAPLPGGFGVFDFSDILNAGYSHMNDANPQLVNEDFVRTWTLSSAPEFDAKTDAFRATNQVNVTIKRKPGGVMSNFLHDNADELVAQAVPIKFKGTGAGFTCFVPDPKGGPPKVPSKMLWIAGGVGITPFMTMWDGIKQVARALPHQIETDILLLFSGRDDDVNVLNHFLTHSGSMPESVTLKIVAFQSVGNDRSTANSARQRLLQEFSDSVLTLDQRRVEVGDIEAIHDLHDREVFMCGPDALMDWSDDALTKLKVDMARRHRESFVF